MEYKNSGGQLSEDRKKITFTDKKNIDTVKLKGTRDLNFGVVKWKDAPNQHRN
ncbi:hypothetical protein MICAF_2470021 [Microcystis aeruginosa PCC 9807]|uniref:Transposase n=1 Tax=Microcystis aeruginosa PCC 9807 TaxID=1160283 RepID=I4H4Z9_MICAE|nr:hypothetical protein MICAF_2470021 [Microcystis aeruginosa PCC 9807]